MAFEDDRVGAVSANLRMRNAGLNLVTRLQECEYALSATLARLITSRLNILGIVAGAGDMIRTELLQGLGGYDTGPDFPGGTTGNHDARCVFDGRC